MIDTGTRRLICSKHLGEGLIPPLETFRSLRLRADELRIANYTLAQHRSLTHYPTTDYGYSRKTRRRLFSNRLDL